MPEPLKGLTVRRAWAGDVPALLGLMRGLATYERYAEHFRVTEAVLLAQGFHRETPDFRALVADAGETVVGMAVYYLVPFTFRARPTLYLKELFVADTHRGRGVGEALMRGIAGEARAEDCAQVRWQVARWNTDAMRFYERLGATADDDWIDYVLDDATTASLARDGRAPASLRSQC